MDLHFPHDILRCISTTYILYLVSHSISNETKFFVQRWQQAKRVFDQLTSDNGRQPSSEEWANSCQVSESELRQSLSDGPKAADLILASVEHLLRSLCYRYLKSVSLFPFHRPYLVILPAMLFRL